jgi:hypothetical protein
VQRSGRLGVAAAGDLVEDGFELAVEEGVRHALVPVDELDRRTGEERAEDRLEPELRREHDEEREEQERRAHADLRGRVLQPDERRRETHGALQAEDRERDGDDKDAERDQERELRAQPARLAGEEERQQDDRRHLSDRRAGDDDLSERRCGLTRVLEDRQDHAEPGRREDDCDEQRRFDQAAGGAEVLARLRGAPRDRLLAHERGPAASRQPGARRPRGAHPSALHRREHRAPQAAGGQAEGAATGARLPSHADPEPGDPRRADPRGGAWRISAERFASETTLRRRSLDVDCKAHDVDNLYVVDTSVFPSSSAVNPGADGDGERAPRRRPPDRAAQRHTRLAARGGGDGLVIVQKLARAIGKGAVAGYAGTAAMTVSSTVETKLRKRPFSTAPARAAQKVLGNQGVRGPARRRPLQRPRPLGLRHRLGRRAGVAARARVGPEARDRGAFRCPLGLGARHAAEPRRRATGVPLVAGRGRDRRVPPPRIRRRDRGRVRAAFRGLGLTRRDFAQRST